MPPTKIAKRNNLSECKNQEISKEHQIHLIPVDHHPGEIVKKDISRLDAKTLFPGKISYKDQLAKGGFLIFVKQWMTLADFLAASPETQNENKKNSIFQRFLVANSKADSASFFKRITKRNGASHDKDKPDWSHGKIRTSKRNLGGTEKLDTTGSKTKAGRDNQELIKIEMKRNPETKEISSGDLLRFKVTMYNVKDKLAIEFDHQVEIGFLQNFIFEHVTKNACRCRHITKLLKRTTLTELEWEKGMHISGKQFAVSWIPYKVPQLESDSIEITEKEMEKVDYARNDDECISGGMYERMFTARKCQFELQIRLYKKVISLDVLEQTQNVLAACSCFPLYKMTVSG